MKMPFDVQIDVMQAVADFYLVLMAEPMFNPNVTNDAKMKMFNRIKGRVILPLANAFYDYVIATCAAEMRHAPTRCVKYYDGYNAESQSSSGSSRARAALNVVQYEPKTFLTAAQRIFNACTWEGSFGGESWGKIAGAGLLYGTVPPVVFVDHCVDLTHNSGVFLDKMMIFGCNSRDRYVRILNSKKNAKNATEFIECLKHNSVSVSTDVLPLVTRLAGNDEILDGLDTENPWKYKPVEWGTKTFDLQLVESLKDEVESLKDEDEEASYESEEPQESQEPQEPDFEDAPARRDE